MNAINWMKSKATVETLSDGTVTYTFAGTLPYRMVQEIKKAANNTHFTNKSSTYSYCDEVTGWAATFGATKGTNHSIRFTFNDYTIPAGKGN